MFGHFSSSVRRAVKYDETASDTQASTLFPELEEYSLSEVRISLGT
jgi:hypothetical protein